MSSEKGDLPQDNDSLPPHYASSEVYSDSPPPAYRKTNTVRLQITRIVCTTILLAGFLIGSFILAHTWVTNHSACDCDARAPNLPPMSASLIQANVLPLDIDNDIAPKIELQPKGEEPIVVEVLETEKFDEKKSRQMDIDIPLNEEEINEDIEIAGRALEEEVEELQSLQEENSQEEPKNVKLPIDMLLGNPALAGKDVQCKVEKKIQNLGNGIFSKTIMVTCDDEDESSEPQKNKPINPFVSMGGMKRMPRPPMSLLAPILKMMSARANARLHKQQQHPQMQMMPKIMLARVPMTHMGRFPPRPFSGPFPPPPPQRENFINFGRSNEIEHINSEPQVPEMKMFQGKMRPNMIPMSFIPHNFMKPQHTEEHEQENHHHSGPPRNVLFREDFRRDRPHFEQHSMEQEHVEEDEEEMMEQPPMKVLRGFPPHLESSPIKVIRGFPPQNESPIKIIRGFPPQNGSPIKIVHGFPPQNESPMKVIHGLPPQNESPMKVIQGFPPQNDSPMKVVRGFPPQIPDAIKEIVSSIMRRGNNREGKEDDTPAIAIRAIPQAIATLEEGPQQHNIRLPFPFRPVKISGGRGARKLDLDDNEFHPRNAPFPLPRGAIPTDMKPIVMPEAGGRALESPVTIPSPSEMPHMRFFPGGLVRIPVPLRA